MKTNILAALAFGGLVASLGAQGGTAEANFERADQSVEQKVAASIAELEELRRQITAEKVPLNTERNELQTQLNTARSDFQDASRSLTSTTLAVTNLRDDIKKAEERSTFLSNILGEYTRKLQTRLHVAEAQLLTPSIERAELAAENSNLSDIEVFDAQLALLSESIQRLEDALGGHRFEGSSVNADSGLVDDGEFLLIGPAGFFRSANGASIGTAEQRVNALQPTTKVYTNPEDLAAAKAVFDNRVGELPIDPTLGNAHRVEGLQESLWEHVQKGGTVMWPIFGLAGIALLIALYKWLSLSLVGKPRQRQVQEILDSVARRDYEHARAQAQSLKGPAGHMLAVGLDHADEPRDLIEEVMYERVLKTKFQVGGLLPFIAICAASAPLLGLLGTVIGIIDTFKLITEFGSGDVQMLSSGISVALITTKFGLIVAIPSLLLHAYLSRKARAIVGNMEQLAVALVNQISKTPLRGTSRPATPATTATGTAEAAPGVEPELVRRHVQEIVRDMLGPLGDARPNGNEATQVG